jgi:Tfp pilus assembly protein PilN
MIRINLLPAELESAPLQLNPAIPLGGAAALTILLVSIVHFHQASTRNKLRSEKESLQSELARYQPILDQVNALEQAKVQLTNRKTVIQQLESERLRYPQFMDDFLKLLPGNLWLTNLTTTSQPGGQMLIAMDVTALDNYAIADLIANLETSQIFTDVDLGAIAATQTPQAGQTMTFRVTANYRKSNSPTDATKKS